MNTYKPHALIIAVAVAGVLLGACFGLFAGGVVGFWIGHGSRSLETRATAQPTTLPFPRRTATPMAVPPEAGAMVTGVVEGGPADQSGIRVGDIILEVDGASVGPQTSLESIIRRHKPGEEVAVVLLRLGRRQTLSVRLGESPSQQGAAYLGVFYVNTQRVAPPGGE